MLRPTARALGVGPLHFGVVAVRNIVIGLIMTTCGLLLFMMATLPDVPLREILPLPAVMLAALAVVTRMPDIVLFLSRPFGYEG